MEIVSVKVGSPSQAPSVDIEKPVQVNAEIKNVTINTGGGSGSVKSVNGQTGDVILDAAAVGALPNTTKIPTKLSQLTADSTHRTVTDAEKTVWTAKQPAGNYVTEEGLTAKGYAKQTDVSKLSEEIADQDGRIKVLEDNPSGATEEQLQQIETNKNNIATLDGKLADEKTAREQSIADLNARLGQQTFNIAQGTTQEEAEAWLAENGDTAQVYLMPDETFWQCKEVTEVVGGKTHTNLADPTSADWKANSRFSSSSGSISSCTGSIVSNTITAKKGDTIRVKGLRNGTVTATANAYVGLMGYTDTSGSTKAFSFPMFFDKTKSQSGGGVKDITSVENGAFVYPAFQYMDKNNSPVEHANSASVVSIRVSGEPVTTVDDIIVTVNEEIVEGGGTTTIIVKKWISTGHGLVATDYDEIISTINRTLNAHTKEIQELREVVENGVDAELTDSEKLNKIKTWDKPVYDYSPVTLIADERVKPALTTGYRTIEAIYAKYRDLMARFPDYITETNMGKSTSSSTFTAVDMLRFDFKEPDGLTQPDMGASALHETKPKLIFLSGIHTEWVGVWGLYYALEEIASNPEFDDIRRNAHIIVIPCANPFCLTSQTAIDGWRMSHVNANGVAIHNNFNVDHSTSGTVGAYNYGGSAPCSEFETQYIDAVMAENPDAVAFVSCHNNDYSTYYGSHVIWASSATYHMCNMAFRLVDKMSKAWIDKYGQTLKDAIDEYKINMDANDYRLGRATMSSSAGTEQKNATKYGIQGVNLEISRMMKVFSGNTDGTSEVMTHGAEVYANFMRTLLTAYDHTDKEQYYK